MTHALNPAQAALRKELLTRLMGASVRLQDYAFRAAIYNQLGRTEWGIKRAEKHLAQAKRALRAWKRERKGDGR